MAEVGPQPAQMARAMVASLVVTVLALLASWVIPPPHVIGGPGASAGDGSVDPSHPLAVEGRWGLELAALLNSCEAQDGAWDMPLNLSAQDDHFWFPGPLRCEWPHAGAGDETSLGVHIATNQSGPWGVGIAIEDGPAELSSPSTTTLSIPPDNAELFAIRLTEAAADGTEITVRATAQDVPEASVTLILHLRQRPTQPVHVEEGNQLTVHYIVWDHDTGERLDEGEFPILAGDDAVELVGWAGTIRGFSWGAIGLDSNIDRGFLGSGSTHLILLPPDLAYGHREGHQLEHSWLRFEQTLREVI